MYMEVHNWGLNIGNVRADNISSSSILLIGDNEELLLSSYFDTPPEAFTLGNIVPLALT
ncbi:MULTISPECIES: spore gernimation protein GerPD [Clostridia]|uniref:spore gernimation protein GerPD n=1 Tax=Clostridia TaxID=186801 RepID=UPI000EA131E4|nr:MULTISPECIES: spore gernimation protein GerPD [Clostridia]NBJ69183.1 spore gernimation protein GerPD [Roseburia sp. 1XD42-34]RKI79602.1 spore gernimation protein GerPD [Clostridium sp. 1xD42-85]